MSSTERPRRRITPARGVALLLAGALSAASCGIGTESADPAAIEVAAADSADSAAPAATVPPAATVAPAATEVPESSFVANDEEAQADEPAAAEPTESPAAACLLYTSPSPRDS